MGSRSRIRWHKVAKLALGVFGCLALLVGLPSLIRRPEPPPLEPDIGLPPLAASQEPALSGQRPERRTPKRTGEAALAIDPGEAPARGAKPTIRPAAKPERLRRTGP